MHEMLKIKIRIPSYSTPTFDVCQVIYVSKRLLLASHGLFRNLLVHTLKSAQNSLKS